jgi:hypothetical protein
MQQRIRDGLPRGFKTSTEVKAVAAAFEKQMIAAGNPYARLAIRGSGDKSGLSGGNRKYTGHPFDRGKTKSDFDFAIVDQALFNRAIRSNVKIASAVTRTEQLSPSELRRLGLWPMADSFGKLVGRRDHSFVVYGSERAIVVAGLSCGCRED